MSSGFRERLNALRPGAAARAPPPASASPIPSAPASAASGVAAGLQLRVTRVPMPEWDLEPAEQRRAAAMLALLSRDEALGDVLPEDLLFLDLETTGLSLGSGTLAFLVGLASLQREQGRAVLVVEQHLLRALSHEAGMLGAAQARVAASRALVTFNGKSYDMPLLQGRCVMSRVAPPPARPHFDALHPARRLLSHELPDVRLLSLERALWGQRREDDLGGAAIPAAFFAALRGDDGMLEDVLRHNADDLVTLARLPPLLARLALGEAAPSGLAADPLALAELRLISGERGAALAALGAASPLPGSPRSLKRARLTKRAGGAEAAREHWAGLCREPRAGAEPHEELAKILEHRDRDAGAALQVVERALRSLTGDAAALERLQHRRERLLRKLAPRTFPGGGRSS